MHDATQQSLAGSDLAVPVGSAGGLTATQEALKRCLDGFAALVGLLLFGWLILLAWLVATVDTRSNGFFTQWRVGRNGELFRIVKLRTMRPLAGYDTTVTVGHDPRITPVGRFLRRSKLDELPQLWNVLIGEMSLVGPRPDVPGFADRLIGADREMLRLRPGITGPATLHFRDEEQLLACQPDPERYNREVVFPEKVRLNLDYLHNYSLLTDVRLLIQTFVGRSPRNGKKEP